MGMGRFYKRQKPSNKWNLFCLILKLNLSSISLFTSFYIYCTWNDSEMMNITIEYLIEISHIFATHKHRIRVAWNCEALTIPKTFFNSFFCYSQSLLLLFYLYFPTLYILYLWFICVPEEQHPGLFLPATPGSESIGNFSQEPRFAYDTSLYAWDMSIDGRKGGLRDRNLQQT